MFDVFMYVPKSYAKIMIAWAFSFYYVYSLIKA